MAVILCGAQVKDGFKGGEQKCLKVEDSGEAWVEGVGWVEQAQVLDRQAIASVPSAVKRSHMSEEFLVTA